MSTNQEGPSGASTAPYNNDLPPPYSAVVGNPQYGFVIPPQGEAFPSGPNDGYPHPPKSFTAPGVYPHPPSGTATTAQPLGAGVQTGPTAPPVTVPVGLVLPPAVGTEPTTITCFNCGKVGTTRVTYTTAWHTHLVAGSVCIITMVCSLCCLGLVPYCFDTFKDAEHYCQHCNTFVGKCNKC